MALTQFAELRLRPGIRFAPPVWRPGDGDTAFHFRDKPAGERCLWSCVWSTSAGLIGPDAIGFGVDQLTGDQARAELLDRQTEKARLWNKGHEIFDALAALDASHGSVTPAVRALIAELRTGAPEYIKSDDKPDRIFLDTRRPGW